MKHVVALSGGKDSTAMALRLRELFPLADYQYVCTPTGNEPPSLFAHLDRLESLLCKPIHRIAPLFDGTTVVGWKLFDGSNGLAELVRRYNALPNYRQRWCTRQLKIEPMEFWLRERLPCVHYVGLRADEETRIGWTGEIEGITHEFPMRAWGWGVSHVVNYLAERGVTVPPWTDCDLCFFKRLSQWKKLRQERPEVYALGESLESEVGHTLRSPKRDTWPAGLKELGEEFDSGRKVRGEGEVAGKCDQESLCRICSM